MTNGERPFWLTVGGLLVNALCLAWSADLLSAWRDSPLDHLGWLPLLIWLAPLLQLTARRDARLRIDARRAPLLVAALGCGAFGSLASLNVLQHVGLILSLTAWTGLSWPTAAWAAAGLACTPAFGWSAATAGAGGYVLLLRVLVSGGGAAVLIRSRSPQSTSPTAESPRSRASGAGRGGWSAWAGGSMLAAAVAVSLTWQFVTLPGAERRLIAMRTAGEGFDSRGLSLSAAETASLGAAIAVRRLYQFDEQRLVATAIDATQNRHAVHDPLYCFTGAGWQIVNDRRVEVPGGAARHVTFAKSGRRTEVVFWFSDGRSRHCAIAGYWWQTTLRRLTCGLSGPEPVLVMLQSADDRPVDWRQILAEGGPFFRL